MGRDGKRSPAAFSRSAQDENLGGFDLTKLDNYEPDYEFPWANKIEKIYEMPPISDMPGVFLRGIFKSEKQLNACLRLFYRHKKFDDDDHQELLRCKIAGTAAINGVRALEALFAGTNLLAPGMYRDARNLPRLKAREKEEVIRGSDLRAEQKSAESELTR